MSRKSRKSRKIKILKNRDIEEYVEQIESKNNNKCEKRSLENKRQEFKESLEVPNKIVQVNIDDKEIERRVKNFSDRRDAQIADHERRVAYLKAMNKEELNDEHETEIQEFFDDIQRKTDEYLKKQDEEEKIKQKKDKKDSKKKETKKRVSGTSMKEILDSQEFKKMWEESKER